MESHFRARDLVHWLALDGRFPYSVVNLRSILEDWGEQIKEKKEEESEGQRLRQPADQRPRQAGRRATSQAGNERRQLNEQDELPEAAASRAS